MTEFIWEERVEGSQTIWRCRTKQTTVELWPRPAYCDRGRWHAHADCPGYPTNPNPIDGADGFPRYYFDLDHAKAEIEAFFRVRHYEPIGTTT